MSRRGYEAKHSRWLRRNMVVGLEMRHAASHGLQMLLAWPSAKPLASMKSLS
jgi:hypothetical protein